MKNLINKIGVLTLVFSFILVSCETVDLVTKMLILTLQLQRKRMHC